MGLAAWRVSSLLANEDGPGDIFVRFRSLLGVPESGELEGLLPKLLTCMWCLTVWMVLVMWGLWEIEPIIVVIIAAMAVAISVERWNSHG